jgi:uncharacterized membrane protein
MQNQKSALGLDGNVTALIGYIVGILALVLIFIEKDNKFVRFHAFQSVLWAAAYIVTIIALSIVGVIVAILAQASGTLGTILGLLLTLVWLAAVFGFLGGLIYAAIKAFGGNQAKLPIVGGMAEKWA